MNKLEEASTHRSAKSHAGTFLTPNKLVSRTYGGIYLCHVWWS